MGLREQAKADAENILSDTDGWACNIILTAPSGEVANITGLHTKHHLNVDTDGTVVNAKKAAISFSEKFLTDLNYPVRNQKGEVELNGHLLFAPDSTGLVKKYIMQNIFPNETIGIITCTLEDYE